MITLVGLSALSTVSLNMFLPALASIAADLNAPYATVSLAVSMYLAITALVLLAVGPLSDTFGRRPVMLMALGIFVIGSLGCALSQNVQSFLGFRVLQGAMITGSAVSMAVVRDTRDEAQSASVLGYISMAMAIGPMLGPVAGGVLDTWLGWRAIFWLYGGLGAALLLVCWVDLGETRGRRTRPTPTGLWHGLGLLRMSRFWAYGLCMSFSTGAFYIFLTGAPLVAREVFGVSSATLGLYVGSITAGFMTGSFLSGRLAMRVAPTTLILAGRLFACLGPSLGLVAASLGLLSPLTCFGATIFVGLGNGLTTPNGNAKAMSVDPTRIGAAAGFAGAMNVGVGAILTLIAGFVVAGPFAAPLLLALMLASSALGLALILWAIRLERAAA